MWRHWLKSEGPALDQLTPQLCLAVRFSSPQSSIRVIVNMSKPMSPESSLWWKLWAGLKMENVPKERVFSVENIKVFVFFFSFMVLKENPFWISFWHKNPCGLFTAGRRPSSDLHADGGSPAGVQQAGKPQRSDVLSVSALPRACQSGLELELSSSKLYPLTTE